MAELFEVKELVQIAVEDERTGVAFYTALSEKDGKLASVFADLAEQEKYHQARFENMLERMGGLKLSEQYNGEYMAYLRTLSDTRAFPDEQTAIQMAKDCKDDAAALDLAGRFERDTLMLMHEMGSLLPEKDQAIVNELIAEEQAHLVTLTLARQKSK